MNASREPGGGRAGLGRNLPGPRRRLGRSPGFLAPLALVVIGHGLLVSPAIAASQVTAALEPAAIQVGGEAVLTVSVEGATRLERAPAVAHPPEVELQSAGQSTNISIVNGRMSRSITFNFVVTATRPGEYTLGPAEIKDGDEILRSQTVKLTVVSARGAPGGSAAPAEEASEGSEALFARVVVDRERIRVGEQTVLRFRVYRRLDVPVLNVSLGALPSTEGFWREDLPPERSSQVTIDGQLFEVNELAYALFPTQSGRLEIGPGEVECVVQDRRRSRRDPFDPFDMFGGVFSTQRRVRLRSRPLTVRVDPLPEPKPADFTGGVGSFHLSARCEPSQVAQNEPVTLTVIVEGTGNVSTVGDPEIPRLPGVRSYPSGSDVQSSRRGDVIAGTKTFRFMLVPENTGRRVGPPIRLSIFDPARGEYVRLSTGPVSFQAVAAAAGAAPSGEVARVGRDLRTIREGTDFSGYGAGEPWRRGGYWALQLLPLALIAAGFAWRVRRDRREADWGRLLSRGAPGRLRRELQELGREPGADTLAAFARLDAAVERYFTDRFHLPVRGMTRDALAAALRDRGASEEAIERARALLDRCDFARFAPGAQSASELAELIALAMELPAGLESAGARPRGGRSGRSGRAGGVGAALAALCFAASAGVSVPTSGGAGWWSVASARAATLSEERAAAELRRGNEAYRSGDAAEALRAYAGILRGGLESADLYLNLGNAAYRAGLLGWSVYFYERGRRLAPRDPDLRANLDLVLQETKDRIPETGGSRFLASLVALEERGSLVGSLRALVVVSWALAIWIALRIALGEPPAGPPRFAVRWLGFALVAWFLVSAAGVLLRAGQHWTAPNAVVVADELPVRSNPDGEATVEFTLHAGTRVRVGREARGFREVLFSDKLRGWGEAGGVALLGAARPASLPPAALPQAP